VPRTKSKPKEHAPLLNGPVGEVMSLSEAAAYLRLPEAEVARLVHAQGLPGRLAGTEWRFLKAAVQHWLSCGSPTWETRKSAILEMAGKYKDDPDLEQIVEDAYRQRGRPITEDGSYKNFSS